MLRSIIYVYIILIFTSCQQQQSNVKPADNDSIVIEEITPPIERDLEDIKKEGVFKAITIYSATGYFLYRGKPMGFEYELLQRLTEHLGLELEIVVAKNLDELFDMLNRGEGDMIAHGMTITGERKEKVEFTEYHFLTRQVLVQKKPDNWRSMKLHEIQATLISDPIELIGETVSIRNNSSYHDRLNNLMEEIGGEILIDTLPGSLSTGEIIEMVAEGKIKYTVADNNIAAINSAYYDNLDIDTDVSFSQRIAWAVRKNSPDLLGAINAWIDKMKDDTDYYVIYNKYFENNDFFQKRSNSELLSTNADKISEYDGIVKKYADSLDWDWRLLSALIYQESEFDPKAESWMGAKGLMQMLGPTAREMGITNIMNPEQNIKAGTRYLEELWERWESIPDSVQRIKFTLASYNCGYYHVVDAQNLARKQDKDPGVWDNHVEDMIVKLTYPQYYQDEVVDFGYVRGEEPYNYVKEIFNLYEQYKKFVPA